MQQKEKILWLKQFKQSNKSRTMQFFNSYNQKKTNPLQGLYA